MATGVACYWGPWALVAADAMRIQTWHQQRWVACACMRGGQWRPARASLVGVSEVKLVRAGAGQHAAGGPGAGDRRRRACRQRALQGVHHLGHGRALAADGAHAVGGEVADVGQRLALVRRRRREARVEHARDVVGEDVRHGEVHHVLGGHALGVPLHDAAAGHELQEHHAEAVHVALVRQVLQPVVLRVHVPHRAAGVDRPLRLLLLRVVAAVVLAVAGGVQDGGQPEVGNLGRPRVVQEDVGGLDVAVDDGRHGVDVHVLDAARGAQRDGEPAAPRQHRRRHGAAVVELVVEGAVHHELVHQHALAGLSAAPQQAHDVLVVGPRQSNQLRVEGRLAVAAARRPRCRARRLGVVLGTFYRHLAPVRERAAVHRPEAPGPDPAAVVEPLRRRAQGVQREMLHHAAWPLAPARPKPWRHQGLHRGKLVRAVVAAAPAAAP
uniref:Predicted protein n=1 Tax=Hordeum vulgare subsp. vulgare TaxID=112509 RepID=F2DQK7_HORVV|nr:predicted protein [Hordeum vulgare subsp. vulgare]